MLNLVSTVVICYTTGTWYISVDMIALDAVCVLKYGRGSAFACVRKSSARVALPLLRYWQLLGAMPRLR